MKKHELTQHDRELIKALLDKRAQILDSIQLLNKLTAPQSDLDRLFEQLEQLERRIAFAESALGLGAEHD